MSPRPARPLLLQRADQVSRANRRGVTDEQLTEAGKRKGIQARRSDLDVPRSTPSRRRAVRQAKAARRAARDAQP